MNDKELDALVERLREAQTDHNAWRWGWLAEACDAITTLRQERDHYRDCISAREVRRFVDERDAARAENEKLRALLKEASDDWIPHASSLSAAIVDALRGKSAPTHEPATMGLVDKLLGEYWDIAHTEGATGISQGDKANGRSAGGGWSRPRPAGDTRLARLGYDWQVTVTLVLVRSQVTRAPLQPLNVIHGAAWPGQ